MPGNGGGPEGPTACSALCSKGIFPASSRPPCTKRRLSVRLGGGYLAFSAHSCDILSYLIRFPAACQEFYCQFCAPGAYWPWQRGRTGCGHGRKLFGKWNPPAASRHPPLTRGAFGRVWDPPLRKYRKLSGKRRRGRRPRRPAGAQCAPLQREKGSMPCAHWGSYPRGKALREGQAPPLRFSRNSSGIW